MWLLVCSKGKYIFNMKVDNTIIQRVFFKINWQWNVSCSYLSTYKYNPNSVMVNVECQNLLNLSSTLADLFMNCVSLKYFVTRNQVWLTCKCGPQASVTRRQVWPHSGVTQSKMWPAGKGDPHASVARMQVWPADKCGPEASAVRWQVWPAGMCDPQASAALMQVWFR